MITHDNDFTVDRMVQDRFCLGTGTIKSLLENSSSTPQVSSTVLTVKNQLSSWKLIESVCTTQNNKQERVFKSSD